MNVDIYNFNTIYLVQKDLAVFISTDASFICNVLLSARVRHICTPLNVKPAGVSSGVTELING
jgi:hypothetical protein